MTVVETTLVFVGIPLGIYLAIAVPTLGIGWRRRPRYRPGQPWDHEPVWWTADAEGADLSELPADPTPGSGAVDRTARGGARGNW